MRRNIDDLEAILDKDPCQTEKTLAIQLNVTQQCISQQLHQFGMVQKHGVWLSEI